MGKKSSKNFVAIPFEAELAIGTLAENVVDSQDLLSTSFDDDIYVISADAAFSMNGQASNEGPIDVGLSHNDYSDAEILEYLDVDPTERHDLISQEHAARGKRIRKWGRFGTGTSGVNEERIGDGTPVRKPLKFAVNEGKNMQFYCVNRGSGATTGRVVKVSGTLYCRWIS